MFWNITIEEVFDAPARGERGSEEEGDGGSEDEAEQGLDQRDPGMLQVDAAYRPLVEGESDLRG